MTASLRQVHADRFAAPTAAEDHDDPAAGRRAGLRMALAGSWTVLPEDEHAAVRERADQWSRSLRPRDAHEGWIVEQFAMLTLRLERCQLQERARRELLASRATTHWDADRRAAAEALASSLARRPAEIARRLELTRHGCQLLADRWERLALALDAQGSWTPAQRSQALDLVGIPAPFREAPTPADAEPPALRTWVAARLEDLARLRAAGLDAFDDLERTAAEAGLAADPDPLLAHLHRLESSLARQVASCRSLLKSSKAGRSAHEDPDAPRPGTCLNLGRVEPPAARPSPAQPTPGRMPRAETPPPTRPPSEAVDRSPSQAERHAPDAELSSPVPEGFGSRTLAQPPGIPSDPSPTPSSPSPSRPTSAPQGRASRPVSLVPSFPSCGLGTMRNLQVGASNLSIPPFRDEAEHRNLTPKFEPDGRPATNSSCLTLALKAFRQRSTPPGRAGSLTHRVTGATRPQAPDLAHNTRV